MGGRVRTEREGHLGWLIFDHPERRNAISVEMWEAIPQAARSLDGDPEVRVVVMRGAGQAAFVSGADISEFERLRTGGPAAAEYDAVTGAAFGSLVQIDKPVLAMIHGFCVGGGCALALSADLRYAADDAVFAVPAARLGLGYALAGIQSLVSLVGPSRAKEILFTAGRVPAERAERMGLVNDVVPGAQLESRVRQVAETIAGNAPLTLRSVKLAVRELAKDSSHRDPEAVAEAIRACFESEDYVEGVRAFLEKRPAAFRGR